MVVYVVSREYATMDGSEVLEVFANLHDALAYIAREWSDHRPEKRHSALAPYVYEGFMSIIYVQEYEVL